MKNKKTKLITGLATILLLVAFIIPSTIYANQNSKSIRLGKHNFKTEKGIDKALKVETKLNDAWKDIKDTFCIDDSEYTLLCTVEDTNKFFTIDTLKQSEKEVVMGINQKYSEIMNTLPIGSTEPVLIVKNDLSTFDLCYKTADGSNVRHHGVLNNGEWKVKAETKKGKPQMEIK